MKFEILRLSWAFIAVVTIIDQVTIRNINLIVRCDRPRYIYGTYTRMRYMSYVFERKSTEKQSVSVVHRASHDIGQSV